MVRDWMGLWPWFGCAKEQRSTVQCASVIRDLVQAAAHAIVGCSTYSSKPVAKARFSEGRERTCSCGKLSNVRTQDHVSVATVKVGSGEEKTMDWLARRGIPAYHRVGCRQNKGSPVLCAERSIKCHKGMCLMAAHYCAGSRPVRDMGRV
jgi:hypothetical protein